VKPLIVVLFVAACSESTTVVAPASVPEPSGFPAGGNALLHDAGVRFFGPRDLGGASGADSTPAAVDLLASGGSVDLSSAGSAGGGSADLAGGGSVGGGSADLAGGGSVGGGSADLAGGGGGNDDQSGGGSSGADLAGGADLKSCRRH
jgi:hypothetical protein